VRTALAAGIAALLAVAPAHSASGWTVAQARRAVLRKTFTATDATQADTPTFTFTVEAATITPAGKATVVRKRKRWRSFRVAATALDKGSGTTIRVGFTLAAGGSIRAFRGPPPDTSQPSFPVRAAFYYPWYPENWSAGSFDPFTKYDPLLGRYDSADLGVIRTHIDELRYGGFAAAIASWWGQGQKTDGRLPLLLDAARQTPFRFAVYYEHEGYANPSVDEIRSDLHYLRDHYFSKPAYLKVDGRPVVFVYSPGDVDCEVAARWHAANDVGAYLDLLTFPGTMHQVGSFAPFAASATGGVRVASADVTGSGAPELVTAAGPGFEPRVSVLDLTTGAVLRTFLAGGGTGGVEVAAAKGEVVTGTGTTVSIWSPAGTLLRSVDTGLADVRVAVGEVDGDGRDEILAAGGSTVRILDGSTLATRSDLSPFGGGTVFAVAAGDVDGDGKAEIVAGSDIGRQDEVRVVRASGALVGSFTAYTGDTGGVRVGAGDLDGDGRADVITGPKIGAPDVHSYSLGSGGFYQNPPAGFYAFGTGTCPCPFDPAFAGGMSVAAAAFAAGAPAELITGVGFGHAPAVATWGEFNTCPDQPDGWHDYTLPPGGEIDVRGGGSFTIQPGFFYAGDAAPRFARDLDRWPRNIRDMVASKEQWQLVISFNEWNEGTSVEPAQEWQTSSGYGAYLDALHANGS
jgi:hypothetical protein